MPSASESTATAVKTGDFLKDRRAYLRSFDAEAIIPFRLRRPNPVGSDILITGADSKGYPAIPLMYRGLCVVFAWPFSFSPPLSRHNHPAAYLTAFAGE